MTNPNDPANPILTKDPWGALYMAHPGLTKLELFAAMAMQGLCATTATTKDGEWDHETLAECAVRIAAETIAALNAPAAGTEPHDA